MKTREILTPLLMSAVVFTLALFVSCASQKSVDEEFAEGMADEVTTEDSYLGELEDDMTPEEASAINELTQQLEFSEGDDAEFEAVAELASADGDVKLMTDSAPIEMGSSEQEDDIYVTDEDAEAAEIAENENTSEDYFQVVEETDEASSELADASNEINAVLTEENALVAALDAASIEEEGEVVSSNEIESVELELPPLDDETTFASTSITPYNSSVTPSVPTAAVTKNGVSLNRYYFARHGDNAHTLSQLLYNTPLKAKALTAWNGGTSTWKAGTLLLYASNTQADDPAMKSFYETSNVKAEEYVVKSGDWLSKIALQKYGNIHSWKEIAAMNKLENPDRIRPSQRLVLYPATLRGRSIASFKTQVLPKAQAPKLQANVKPESIPAAKPKEPNDTQASLEDILRKEDERFLLDIEQPKKKTKPAKIEPIIPDQSALDQNKVEAEKATFEFVSFLQHHLLMVTLASMGALIALLLLIKPLSNRGRMKF